METHVSKLFFENVKEKLSFLVTQFGYKGPFSNLDSNNPGYVYLAWYEKNNLTIEFHYEVREQDVGCYIARLIDGKRPEGWLVNEQGEQIRISLSQWIRSVDSRAKLFTNVSGMKIEEQISQEISDYANLLQRYGKAFLEDKAEVFPSRKPFS